MNLADLSKDVRRLLLDHWSEAEIEDRLSNPEYFFEQVVAPRLAYLRRRGEDAPRVRFQRTASGEARVLLLP